MMIAISLISIFGLLVLLDFMVQEYKNSKGIDRLIPLFVCVWYIGMILEFWNIINKKL